MHLCGQTLNGTGWFGVVFDTQEEAEKVKLFLEDGVKEIGPVFEQIKKAEEFNKKGKTDVGQSETASKT